MPTTEAAQKPAGSPLLTAPIPGLIRTIAIPTSVGAFFNTLFNVVDTIYGGLISDQALAALSLSFPLYFIIIAIGYGFGTGNNALMGNALGQGKRADAQRFAVQGVMFGLVASLFLTFIVGLALPPLVRVLGATDPAYEKMALDYIQFIFYGSVCFVTVQMLTSTLNTLGKTKPGRNFLIGGFLLNLLLDPWFIFGGFGLPAMGIRGIALATVLVQGLGCIYIGFEVSRAGLVTKEAVVRYWRLEWRVVRQILEQGFPNVLDMMGVSLGFFVLTYFVSQFGQEAVAAFGSASRIEQVALLPLLGLNVATLALTARNNGAQLPDRVNEVWRTAIRYGTAVMFVTMFLVVLFARPMMSLFTDNETIIEIGVTFSWIRALGLIPNAIFFMSSSAVRGLKKPVWPLVINMLRFVILPVIFILIAVNWLNYGLTAIWIVSTFAFFMAAVAGWIMAVRMLPKRTAVSV